MLAVSAMSVALRVPEMCPALSGMSIKTSERIAKRMAANARTFKDGEYLWGDQPAATEAYVVQTGRVVSEVLDGRLELLADQRCVGFEALFGDQPHFEKVARTRTHAGHTPACLPSISLTFFPVPTLLSP